MTITHTKVSGKPDTADGTLVQPSDWNAEHEVTADTFAACWPVGSVFTAVVNTNPATLLGFGTWTALAAGRMLVGFNAADTDFDTAKETGGAKTVTLTAAQSGLPQHTHVQDQHRHQTLRERSATTGAATTQIARTGDTSSTADVNVFTEYTTPTNQDAGPTAASAAHTNMPPYLTVFFWERTA